jgi:hypothetical protein
MFAEPGPPWAIASVFDRRRRTELSPVAGRRTAPLGSPTAGRPFPGPPDVEGRLPSPVLGARQAARWALPGGAPRADRSDRCCPPRTIRHRRQLERVPEVSTSSASQRSVRLGDQLTHADDPRRARSRGRDGGSEEQTRTAPPAGSARLEPRSGSEHLQGEYGHPTYPPRAEAGTGSHGPARGRRVRYSWLRGPAALVVVLAGRAS